MKKALLVMDLENVYVGEEHASYFQYENHALLEEVNKVIDANKDNLVIYIRNLMEKSPENDTAPFHAYEGTKEVEFVKELHMVSDHIFVKYESDAFSNPALIKLLKEQEIQCVELMGIDGGGCVAKTALRAIKEGYEVVLHKKAIGTMFQEEKEKYWSELAKAGTKFV